MSTDRNEEMKRRVIEWEEANGKKLEDCSREEWISAMCKIMALSKFEAEEYLNYLWEQKGNREAL